MGKKLPLSAMSGDTVRCPKCGRLGKEAAYYKLNPDRTPAVLVKHAAEMQCGFINVTETCAFRTVADYEQDEPKGETDV